MRVAVAATLVVIAIAGVVFWTRLSGDEADIRRRLDGLVDEINDSTVDGAGIAARAAQIGSYFTEDVTISLGAGSAPIQGRATLTVMAARLQPRTSAFILRMTDIIVRLPPDDHLTAAVALTAQFRRRAPDQEDDLDAQEYALELRKTDGQWRIARVRSVDTFK